MAWCRTGTVSLTTGSNVVTGTGTDWKKNINGIGQGQALVANKERAEILYVDSDTQIRLARPWTGSAYSGAYHIETAFAGTTGDSARQVMAALFLWKQMGVDWDKWLTSEAATVEVTNVFGEKVTIPTYRALFIALDGKVNYAAHADVGGVDSIGNGSINAALNRLRVYRTNAGIVTVYSRPSASEPYQTEQAFPVGRGVIWSTSNTKTDTNGFIKKASPVIEIHPDGHYETNDESEGAVVSRIDTGQYHITGILGYNSDGAWGINGGISVPKDVNGLELVYIKDEMQPDGSILIKTYHRQHTHIPEQFQNKRRKEDGSYYSDGEPCDLPESTRLDVRVGMPAGDMAT